MWKQISVDIKTPPDRPGSSLQPVRLIPRQCIPQFTVSFAPPHSSNVLNPAEEARRQYTANLPGLLSGLDTPLTLTVKDSDNKRARVVRVDRSRGGPERTYMR